MTINTGAPVVVGVDGSAAALDAVRVAAREAEYRQRPLRVVHAFIWPMTGAPLGPVPGAPANAGLRNQAEQYVTEAVEQARKVSPDLPLPIAVRSTGIAPQHLMASADGLAEVVREAVEKLLGEVEGTVGVIAPDAAFRDRVRSWLKADDRIGVVTALAAKGMEYDAVALIEPGLVESARTLYVALSRATQRLTTVATTDWR